MMGDESIERFSLKKTDVQGRSVLKINTAEIISYKVEAA